MVAAAPSKGVVPSPEQLLLRFEVPLKFICKAISWVHCDPPVLLLPVKATELSGKYIAPVMFCADPPTKESVPLDGALRSWKKASPAVGTAAGRGEIDGPAAGNADRRIDAPAPGQHNGNPARRIERGAAYHAERAAVDDVNARIEVQRRLPGEAHPIRNDIVTLTVIDITHPQNKTPARIAPSWL